MTEDRLSSGYTILSGLKAADKSQLVVWLRHWLHFLCLLPSVLCHLVWHLPANRKNWKICASASRPMQREMDKTSESKSEAADALRESERAISNSNRKLAELAAQQRAADQKLSKLQGTARIN